MYPSITLRVPQDLKEQLEKEAANEGRSLSNYVKRILEARKKKK